MSLHQGEVVFNSEQVGAVVFAIFCLILGPLCIVASRASLAGQRSKPTSFGYRRMLVYLNELNAFRGMPIQDMIYEAQWHALAHVQLALGIGLILVGVPFGIWLAMHT